MVAWHFVIFFHYSSILLFAILSSVMLDNFLLYLQVTIKKYSNEEYIVLPKGQEAHWQVLRLALKITTKLLFSVFSFYIIWTQTKILCFQYSNFVSVVLPSFSGGKRVKFKVKWDWFRIKVDFQRSFYIVLIKLSILIILPFFQVVERILFIYAKLNPGINYVQVNVNLYEISKKSLSM